MTKVKFLRNYTPRKKGEVAELEDSLAHFYLSGGIAELADAKAKVGECKDCNKKKKAKK